MLDASSRLGFELFPNLSHFADDFAVVLWDSVGLGDAAACGVDITLTVVPPGRFW